MLKISASVCLLFMIGVNDWKWGLIKEKHDLTEARSPKQIFSILLETATLSEQIRHWKQNCLAANQPQHRQLADAQKATRADKMRIRTLERELRRKDRALAESAALLVLQEKLGALRSSEEDE